MKAIDRKVMKSIDRVPHKPEDEYRGSTLFGFKVLTHYDRLWKNHSSDSPSTHLYRNNYEGMIRSVRNILRRSYGSNR